MPVGRVTPRLERRFRPSGLAGAVLLHAGLIACLAAWRPSVSGVSTPGNASAGTMLVTLVRSPASAQAQAAEARYTAASFAPSRPSKADAGMAAAMTGQRRGQADAAAPASAAPARQADDGAAGQLRNTVAGEAAGSEYKRRLLAHIESFKHYPGGVSARGVVELVFEINRTGGVLGVWVVKSSGVGVLDTAAVDTVRRSQPVPSIPAGLPDLLTVPVSVAFDDEG
jgi:protein TonB